jgi:rare lipoprotein A
MVDGVYSMPLKIAKVLSITLVMVSGLTSCTRKPAAQNGAAQVGIASWYGKQFQGRLTASGEPFDMEKMTAAHRTLPFGAKVRVHNLINEKTTEVRINDRGPFVGDRIIDLSHAAAQTIEMPGIANVRLEVLSVPPTRGADVFAVQIGEFPQRADALRLVESMQKRYGTARLVFRDEDQAWRVLVGMEPTMERAEALAQQLQKEVGPDVVVRVDTEQ